MKRLFFLVLLLLSFVGKSQNSDNEFKILVSRLVEQKATRYDTINFYLKKYIKDSVKMNYLVVRGKRVAYKEGESYGLYGLGDLLVNKSLFDKAMPLHKRGLLLAKESENKLLQILHLNKLGMSSRRTSKIREAIDYYQKSMKIVESIKKPSYETLKNHSRTINSIGSVHIILQQYNRSIEYFKKAIKIQDSLDYKLGLAINNQNIGYAYEELGNLDLSFSYYEKSLGYNELINSDLGRVICKNSMGQIYIKKGKYAKAEAIIKPLIPVIRETEDQFHIAAIIINYGWANLKLNRLKLAEQYLIEGFKISKEFNLQYSLVEVYALLSDLEVLKGNNKKAIALYKQSIAHRDEVFNDHNVSYLNQLTEQYNNEKKNRELVLQQLELKKQHTEIQIKKTQYYYMTGIAIFLLVASVLLWFLFQQRQKRKNQEIVTLKREYQIKTLESLIKGEEKERFRIAKELHDGINGDLSAIKFKLSSLLKMNNKVIKEAIIMIDDSCKQVRAISHNLVPPSLANFNLIEVTQEYCNNMDEVHIPEVCFLYIGDYIAMSKNVEINIFRIVQELVTNSIKHAEANEINVQISCRDNTTQLTIEDNGKGFEQNNVSVSGIGLKNVQSRINYLQATMDLVSNKKGTSYTIEIDTNLQNGN